MSFQDLERGLGERAPLARDTAINPDEDLQFKALARSISVQVQKVSANTAAIAKFVDLLGGSKDNSTLRNRLHDLTESTREVLKGSTGGVKRLNEWKLSPSDRNHRQEQQKVAADFQRALEMFQSVSRRSAERQRLFVERAKANVDEAEERAASQDEAAASGQLLELQETQQQISDADVDFQEQLIQEREGEIAQIEQGITELNQIFKDLGQIVGEQQSMIDNIETNVISVARDTRGASDQLTQAHAYQRKAGRRMFCLLLVFLLVLTIVLLAVLL
ncbi:SNAP receptor [Rhodotorula toruloides]